MRDDGVGGSRDVFKVQFLGAWFWVQGERM